MVEEQKISPISSSKDSGLGVMMFDSLLSHFSGNNLPENIDPALLKQMRKEFEKGIERRRKHKEHMEEHKKKLLNEKPVQPDPEIIKLIEALDVLLTKEMG